MSKRFEGKVAVVTGASKGIGAAIAKQLASEGASVVVNYASSKEGAERVVSEIKKNGGKAISAQGDMAKKSDITRLFDEAKKAFGRIDVLINNAGIYEFARSRQSPRKTSINSSTSTFSASFSRPKKRPNTSDPRVAAS